MASLTAQSKKSLESVENLFDSPRVIRILPGEFAHKELLTTKKLALDGLRNNHAGIIDLVDNYKFRGKTDTHHLNLEKSVFGGEPDELLQEFQVSREREKEKQINNKERIYFCIQ